MPSCVDVFGSRRRALGKFELILDSCVRALLCIESFAFLEIDSFLRYKLESLSFGFFFYLEPSNPRSG